ncbi:MAG: 2,3-bisphosphoglycerate-independent phosphoglycerate mutase [Candidatus Heimdallarchaeota archaeon]|nr:2,3-bisphosphoglycerate-independent phosphoglycerate mutase [Candidatus Heimdallarchaeota archaeon]
MYKLKKLSAFHGRSGPLLLIIMDGIGLGKEDKGNAVFLARPKTLERITKECKKRKLFCKLKAHGTAVGLISDKDMGNSEVGHNALGSGQIYNQGAKLVEESIESGRLFETALWKDVVTTAIRKKSTVHLIGLLSDGNVHSNLEELFGLIQGLARAQVPRVRIHVLTDGRDVPARSALKYIHLLEDVLQTINKEQANFDYRIASGGGRMYVTMDRYESNWEIVRRGWLAHVLGKVQESELKNGYKGYFTSAEEAIKNARKCFPEKNDQFLPPFVIINSENGEPVGRIRDNDIVINFNFRGDRAIQISKAFEQEDFDKFDREFYPKVKYIGLLEYDGDEHIPKHYLVPPPNIQNVLSDYCCANNIKSFAIAETHKFGHVTYFWNGNRTGYVCPDKEKYVEIKSDPNELIPTKPEMKAREVCQETIKALRSGEYQFLRVNFANGDMVGHTGNIEAAVKAVTTVDECLHDLLEVVAELKGITIVTADHGNCDDMLSPDGKTKTAHSLNPVGFWIVDNNWQGEYEIKSNLEEPSLANVAATILNLLGFEQPASYRESLLTFKQS